MTMFDRFESFVAWWNRFKENDIYVKPVLPPSTPTNICLLRRSMTFTDTPGQVDRTLDTYTASREPSYELTAN